MSRLFEFRWNSHNLPYFRMVEGDELRDFPLHFGVNCSLEILDNPLCTGYEKKGKWHPCVVGGVRGVKKCDACKAEEGMSAAQYCDGFNTEMFGADELESLNCPHYLYFALFDKNLIKVGVSSLGRGFLRQIEQGTHFALIVAEGMWGVPARQMETMIRRTGMIDKIQSSQKTNLIFPEITESEGRDILQKILVEKKPSVLGERPDFEQFFKEPPEFKSFAEFYKLQTAASISKPLTETTLEVGESVSGTLISAKGPFLVLETDAEKVLIDAKKLKGYSVDFSPKNIGLRKNDAFQSALF